MVVTAKNPKKDPAPKRWIRHALDGLRSELTWSDLFFGMAAALIIAALLVDAAALHNLQRPTPLLGQLLGFFLFAAIFLYVIWRYFVYYQKRHRDIRSHTLLIVAVIIALLSVMRLLTTFADLLGERLSIPKPQDPSGFYYVVPFAFAALLVTLLVDANLALIVSTVVGILTGLFFKDIHIATYAVVGSLAGIYGIRQYKERSALFKAGLTVGLVNAVAMCGILLLRQGGLGFPMLATNMAVGMLSGLLASALSSVLLPALESIFRITTDVRLLELSNLNLPILRRLSVEAPGTYHHSLMTGTLAEAAAEAIGANSLLVRVAAYYHDLGKMLKPEYFLENQAFGANKHESLAPSMSCLILASHVKDGLPLARESGLTQTLRDMIPQHHGTRVMTFFFQKAKEAAEAREEEIADADYRYPGPKPQTREAAILMMADAVEAASRTLSNPSAGQIQGMIDRLIDDILSDNQLDECEITIREIRLVKESFFKTLSGIHHRRIDYPGYDFGIEGKKPETIRLRGANKRQAKAL